MLRRSRSLVIAALLSGCDGSFRFDPQEGADASTDVQADVAPPPACTDDTSCLVEGAHCDVPSGACVACVADEHCVGVLGRPRCDTALHRCVECGNNQDCGNFAVCESSTHLCVRTCTEDFQCVAPSSHCSELKKRCFECTGNGECSTSGRPRCELLTGRCVQCTNNTHCSGTTRRCDVATFTCVECVDGNDCASGACNPTTRTCVN